MRDRKTSIRTDNHASSDNQETTKPPVHSQALFQHKKERKVQPENEAISLVSTKKKRKCLLRVKLAQVMYSRVMDFFILIVILAFTVLTVISLALECESESDYKTGIEIAELALLVVFIVEIALKWLAMGMPYLKSLWNVFDAVLVLFSFILACIALSSSSTEVGFLKYSVILRLLRLAVAFRRFNEVKRIKDYYVMKGRNAKFSVNTKSERVVQVLIRMLQEPWMQADHSLTEELQWCIETVKSNKLHEAVLTMAGKGHSALEEELITIVNQYSTPHHNKSATLARRRSSRLNHTPSVAEVEKEESLAVRQFLASVDFLDFDIFSLKTATNGNELLTLMQLFFNTANLMYGIGIDPDRFTRYVSRVQSGYNTTIPYHTATHAADVVQTMHYFITTAGVGEIMHLTALEMTGCYLAAAVHDFEHPGVNNIYLVNTQSELAIRYNDKSVLENHHVSAAFALASDDALDIYTAFSSQDFSSIRSQMIEMVLATDNFHHFSHIAQLNNKFSVAHELSKEDKNLLFPILLHAADISNPSKPWELCKKWTELVITEFWLQGDKEREQGLPLGYLMDRKTVNIAKSQIGFIDVIVLPTFEALKIQFPSLQENCSHLRTNKAEWSNRLESCDIHIPDPSSSTT